MKSSELFNPDSGDSFALYAELKKLNPLHYVPVLVDGDVVVSDSFAILLVVIHAMQLISRFESHIYIVCKNCLCLVCAISVFGRKVS